MEQTTEVSHELIGQMLDSMNTGAVFGEPVQQGDVTVIPVARLWYGFGEGSGSGTGAPSEEGSQMQLGEGRGGGGGAHASPLGYVRISGDNVRFEPIMDTGLLALAGMALVAWNVFWIGATVRAFARRG